MPKASIILSSYNNLSALELSVESLRYQTEKDFEIIIADDGSTGGTIEYLEKEGIKYFSRPNEGYRLAYIWNRGAELATGDRFIFGNSDIIWSPDHIYSHLQFANDVVAGSYPSIPINKVPLVTKDLIKNNFSFIRSLSNKDRRFRFIEKTEKPYLFDGKDTVARRMHGGNWSCTRKDFDEVGGLDENFKGWGGEDFDIARRLSRLGKPIKFCLQTIGFHLDHDKNPKQFTSHLGKSYFNKKWDLISQGLPEDSAKLKAYSEVFPNG